ncbi:NUDIX hydrolase [Candidatus Bipolaricaulota bacterium]|nr:NUDIX hydrolase [Candidatus Bipolaricaulota bacterium]
MSAGNVRRHCEPIHNKPGSTITVIKTIADFVSDNTEAGVGLALQDDKGRYLFFLAGTRHSCPPGELFYAGIGGHREEGEDWLTCAYREANEEIGTDIEILSAPITWYIPQHDSIQQLEVIDQPRPLAFYEMIHPPGTPRADKPYCIVIFKARLCGLPKDLPQDELQGVIALTAEQVIRGPERKPALAQLIDEGASLVAGGETVNGHVRLYPIGTAMALAYVLRYATDSIHKVCGMEKPPATNA